MKKMLKVLAMMLALAIAFGCMIAFAENNEEGTTEEIVIETPAATEEPEVKEEKAEAVEQIVEAATQPTVEPAVEVTAEPTIEPTVETATEPTAEVEDDGVEFIEEDVATETDLGLVTIEDAPVPLAAPERSVRIFTTLDSVVNEGEEVKLTSKLTGFDDVQVSLQWQYSDDRGENWKSVNGANEDEYIYEVSAENINYAWRLAVEIVG